jgi:hypothetical protein
VWSVCAHSRPVPKVVLTLCIVWWGCRQCGVRCVQTPHRPLLLITSTVSSLRLSLPPLCVPPCCFDFTSTCHTHKSALVSQLPTLANGPRACLAPSPEPSGHHQSFNSCSVRRVASLICVIVYRMSPHTFLWSTEICLDKHM